ncbi:class I SAM-dependent methyltransferase [Haliea sp. E1-2-M8]|uniref:class I SAM-dependent methyltransferase n=1 Tax=Haliea sp. E1-2-M8 TaxID=3064706 RepID=UPI00271C15E0|nr:class I SAM-dependent methyltransferase [Haliea sp. E1-2-M8]MDO8860795.1 class I SAM-dependent methyltransferase [Haliea sp. E1-2-M8]
MAALQLRLYGGLEQALARVAPDKGVVGLGMSDASVYSYWLEQKFSYTNTFFHTRPYLDIRKPGTQYLARNDFVISSDVLEHVSAPLDSVFANLHALLRPGGVLVFTVPYALQGQTVEHFPELHDFEIIGKKSDRQLINRTQDGREKIYTDLCFHGGDGATLELRLFSLPDLLAHLEQAGFQNITVHAEDHPEWGIVHTDRMGAPVSAIA